MFMPLQAKEIGTDNREPTGTGTITERLTIHCDTIKEAYIRPIAKTLDWGKQRQMWKRLRKGTIGLQRKAI
jgi:hypothetical protein